MSRTEINIQAGDVQITISTESVNAVVTREDYNKLGFQILKDEMEKMGKSPEKHTDDRPLEEQLKDPGMYVKTCKRCGKVFRTPHQNRNFCYDKQCLKNATTHAAIPFVIEPKSTPPKEIRVIGESLPKGMKTCITCGRAYVPKSNNQKKCHPNCQPLSQEDLKDIRERIDQSVAGKTPITGGMKDE